MAFGVRVVRYSCHAPLGTFRVPRFDGVILNGTDPEYPPVITKEGNQLIRFRVDGQPIPVNQTRMEECWYDLKSGKSVETVNCE